MLEEIWIPTRTWEGVYETCDTGNIRSLDRVVEDHRGRTKRLKGRVLVNVVRTTFVPYRQVRLSFNGRQETHLVHSLVADAFLGPRPAGAVVRHKDGDPSNNRADNLEYTDHKTNTYDMFKHGTACLGQKATGAKLTETVVLDICRLLDAGSSIREVSKEFGTCYESVWQIHRGRKWNWLTGRAGTNDMRNLRGPGNHYNKAA